MLGAALALLLPAALLASACGGDSDGSTAAPTAPAATPAPKVARTADASGRITVIARNLEFDTDQLGAAAGPLTITFDNQDGGIAHNIHFFAGADPNGESVGEASLENGPFTEDVAMDLQAGTYFFHCDVHPNMKGNLTVTAS